jgi:hypothetical protein
VRSARVEADKFAISRSDRLDYFKVVHGKGNNSRKGQEIWRRFVTVWLPNEYGEAGDDVGVPEEWLAPGHGEMTPAREEVERKANHVYLTLLDRFNAMNRPLHPTSGPSYAPNLFHKEPEAKLAEVSKAMLAEAQRRLFAEKRIKTDTIGTGANAKVTITRV